MSLRILLALFATIVVVRATGGHFGNTLTAEQKQELEALKTEVKSDQSLTKAQIKQKFENYFNSLPAENKVRLLQTSSNFLILAIGKLHRKN